MDEHDLYDARLDAYSQCAGIHWARGIARPATSTNASSWRTDARRAIDARGRLCTIWYRPCVTFVGSWTLMDVVQIGLEAW